MRHEGKTRKERNAARMTYVLFMRIIILKSKSISYSGPDYSVMSKPELGKAVNPVSCRDSYELDTWYHISNVRIP